MANISVAPDSTTVKRSELLACALTVSEVQEDLERVATALALFHDHAAEGAGLLADVVLRLAGKLETAGDWFRAELKIGKAVA
jgi:hypothetical protein